MPVVELRRAAAGIVVVAPPSPPSPATHPPEHCPQHEQEQEDPQQRPEESASPRAVIPVWVIRVRRPWHPLRGARGRGGHSHPGLPRLSLRTAHLVPRFYN